MANLLPRVLTLLLASFPSLALAQAPSLPSAQPGEGELVDRVVAIIGDSAVFYSQVQEQVVRLQASGMNLPDEPAELDRLEREVLDEIVDQMLMLNAATQDTLISVPDARVDQEAERAWQDVVGRFGSEAATTVALEREGLSVAEYRATQREEIRKSLLIETFTQARRSEARPYAVEEGQILEFYERERENLGQRPATITFDQVVIAPEPSESVWETARNEATEILALLGEGEEFPDLARRFSDDPGSAPRGGELGWVRRGVMVPEFEDAAFGMGRGELSGIVETQFGAHIIQVERVRGAERLVRHILIATDPTPADIEAARERAATIRDEVRDGGSLDQFYEEGEDTGLPHPMTLSIDRLGQLPSGLAQALQTASAGEILGPIEIEPQPGRPSFAVVQVQEIREAGEITLDDVRDQIRNVLQDEAFRDQLLEQLRSETYVEVRW